jgi:glycosyltransferase involved in cell wall biosynthesis
MPLGDLRNASRDAAQGDFICNWDDDDLYGSHRIERQLYECLRSKAVGHFYNRVLLWWPNRKLLGISGPRRWENTMFVKREILPRYLPVALREDTPVVQELERKYKIATSDDPEMYCYTANSINTSGDAHFEHLFEHADWVYGDYREELVRLTANYPIRAYADQMIAAKASSTGETFMRNDGTPLVLCSNASFGRESLKVDGMAFLNCTFEGTKFIYLGGAIPVFENCNLLSGNISFEGSASNTVTWIRTLKNLGINLDI